MTGLFRLKESLISEPNVCGLDKHNGLRTVDEARSLRRLIQIRIIL